MTWLPKNKGLKFTPQQISSVQLVIILLEQDKNKNITQKQM
jgi:hypothetical protein